MQRVLRLDGGIGTAAPDGVETARVSGSSTHRRPVARQRAYERFMKKVAPVCSPPFMRGAVCIGDRADRNSFGQAFSVQRAGKACPQCRGSCLNVVIA
jgi:hypothetical protein